MHIQVSKDKQGISATHISHRTIICRSYLVLLPQLPIFISRNHWQTVNRNHFIWCNCAANQPYDWNCVVLEIMPALRYNTMVWNLLLRWKGCCRGQYYIRQKTLGFLRKNLDLFWENIIVCHLFCLCFLHCWDWDA